MSNKLRVFFTFLFVAILSSINILAEEVPSWLADKLRSGSRQGKVMAIEQLSENMAEEATLLLLESSRDEDDAVRAKAFWTLAYRIPQIKGSATGYKVAQRFVDGARDKSPEVRKYASRGLIFAEDKLAVPALIELMNDDNDAIRQQAYISLRILTGIYIESNRFYWEQWYNNRDNPKFFKRLEWFAPELQDSFKKQRVLELINNRDNWISESISPALDMELINIGKIAYKELSNFALDNDWVNPEIFGTLKKIDQDQTVRVLKEGLKRGRRVPVCARWLGCEDQESYSLLLGNYGKGNSLIDYQIVVVLSSYKDLGKVLEFWGKALDEAELATASVVVKQAGLRYTGRKDERERIRPVLKRALFHKNPRLQEVAVSTVREAKLVDFNTEVRELLKDDNIEVSRLANQVAEEMKGWGK